MKNVYSVQVEHCVQCMDMRRMCRWNNVYCVQMELGVECTK